MIQIDVVLKIGECEKQMTMDEARNLYFELNRLFNNGIQQGGVPMTHPHPPVNPSNLHPEVEQAREAARTKTGGCGGGCGGSKKKRRNPPPPPPTPEQKTEG